MKIVRESINENVNRPIKIADKDWMRMSDLVLADEDGAGVAKTIKDKTKAICRYVAGIKLANDAFGYKERWQEFFGAFSDFANKALQLGATVEEIKNTYDANEVPDKYKEKLSSLSNKKLNNRFVGDISRKILDAGYDINFLQHNGYAITNLGKEAMSRNGRKWTIGYKTEITINGKTYNLVFDAITDEGDGPTSYVISNQSDGIFDSINQWEAYGKLKFIANIMECLNRVK